MLVAQPEDARRLARGRSSPSERTLVAQREDTRRPASSGHSLSETTRPARGGCSPSEKSLTALLFKNANQRQRRQFLRGEGQGELCSSRPTRVWVIPWWKTTTFPRPIHHLSLL
ncbi:hypothetical protein LR48_Vigan03g062500 [Vigna angularis]|uniref:Uncharacterized protein n=1 Tax=Phaseolus angularis TaxID=3914 RepID=A0A0L9U4B1_PHAAN|nr:hypothetical protein LR48_Vigan03g062500 [Vigna angularis]